MYQMGKILNVYVSIFEMQLENFGYYEMNCMHRVRKWVEFLFVIMNLFRYEFIDLIDIISLLWQNILFVLNKPE